MAGQSIIVVLFLVLKLASSILYVQRNEYRSYDELNNLWDFVREPRNSLGIGLQNRWFEQDISTFANATVMPVPSAYNDLSADAALRDHIGWVWYQQSLYTHSSDANSRTYLRFGSVNYYAVVYVNGQQIGDHTGGHLPFEFEVTNQLKAGQKNRITVAVNNTLSYSTIPQFVYKNETAQGLNHYPEGFFEYTVKMDFFNYAGILRPVYVVKKPMVNIADILVQAAADGTLTFAVNISGQGDQIGIRARVFDGAIEVYSTAGTSGATRIANVKQWWPRGMGDAYLYTFQVEVNQQSFGVDVYRLKFGFRTVTWDENQLYINSKPFYCIGFGMHEDSDFRGRGFDQAVMTKDLNLFEWIGANCYRTSHYPYSEERQFENDRRGIVIFTEAPAVALKNFSTQNLLLHKKMVEEMITRDRNHPSTIAWSLANEPESKRNESKKYFRQVVEYAKSLDSTRPTMLVLDTDYYNDLVAEFPDIIGINRYYGWYQDMGYLDIVNQSLVYEITLWKNKFKKPIVVTEYGADSLVGLSEEPAVDFSVQYQDQVAKNYHAAFDALRAQNIITGEMIWNFADFMTSQALNRAVGNHKGVFTRSRQPKMVAYTLRARYQALLNQR